MSEDKITLTLNAEEEKVEQPSTPISTSIFAPTVDNAPLFGDAMRTTPEFVSMDNAVNFDSNAFSFAPETPVVEEVVEEVEEEVEEENEETLGGNIAEDDPELAELRKKWLAKYDDIADHAPIHDTRLLTEQQVHCPRCNTLLHVRFGWTKAKCSKCGAIFELRKRSQDYFNH